MYRLFKNDIVLIVARTYVIFVYASFKISERIIENFSLGIYLL